MKFLFQFYSVMMLTEFITEFWELFINPTKLLFYLQIPTSEMQLLVPGAQIPQWFAPLVIISTFLLIIVVLSYINRRTIGVFAYQAYQLIVSYHKRKL